MQNVLSVAAGALMLASFFFYIRAIVRGRAKPSIITWFVWAGMDWITLVVMYKKEAVNGQIIGACIGATTVALLSLRLGFIQWSLIDGLCVVGCVLGVVLGQVFSDPMLALMASLGAMFLGSIPTFRSAWEEPARENKAGWTISFVSSVCAAIAIQRLAIEDVGQPATFLLIQGVMVYLLWIRKPKPPPKELPALYRPD